MNKTLPILMALAASYAAAQSIQVTVTANGTSSGVTSGGSVSLTANTIGQPVTAIVTVTSTAQITNVTVGGSPTMTLGTTPILPSATTSFTVQYLPASGASVTGVVSIFTGGTQTPVFFFNVNGTVPSMALSYYIAPNGTSTALGLGSPIAFPTTNLGSSSNAVVSILNSGSATGSLVSTTITGSDFQIASSPAPATIIAGQQVTFTVTYTPHGSGASSGSLTVSLSTGSFTFSLSGTGAAPNMTAQYMFADNNAHTLSSGVSLSFPSVDINASTGATVQILNQGTGAGTVSAISISGAGFQLNGVPALPATVAAGQAISFRVLFAPTQAGSFNGTLNIQMTGVSITAGMSGSTAPATFSVRYVDPATSNVLPLASNGTLPFPNTLAGGSSTITVQVVNSGTGTGAVNSIALSGAASAFQLLNLPPLPLSVPPAQVASFAIRFSPQQLQSYTDTLSLDLNGQATVINLQGQSTQAQYTYTWSSGSTTGGVASGGTLAIADTAVGQTTSVVLTITNNGTADGQIANIAVTGQGLSLSGVPALPLTLHAGGSQHFTINFTPAQPVAVSGQLVIGGDSFTVTGTGLGSQLIYSYSSGAAAVSVAASGVVLFPPLSVGGSEKLSFSIQNTGTTAAAISTINLAAPSTVFSLAGLPALPMNLAAGDTVRFSASFAPNNTGTLTATLQVNTSTFSLSGNGTQPAALPSYQFQTPSGSLQPAQQPAIGLTLASPYPSDLQGTLTLTFVPAAFADDSSIQFASGGRTVSFTIPANTTQALFNGKNTIALQTGTSAGNIVLTPAFAMQSGFNLTPSSPDKLTLTLPASAPQLLNGTVTAVTAASFTLTITGYSTSRVLRELDVQFSPKAGQNFSATTLTIDVSSPSSSWFQSTVSQGFGGSFLMAIPFTLSGGNTAGADLVHMLQSLSITAKNDVGASTALSVSIP